MARLIAFVLLLAVCLPAASASGAVTVGALAAAPTFGPFLGGDGAVWVQGRADHSAADVMTQAPGAPARLIGSIPERPGATGDELTVEVSGGYLAYGYLAEDQSSRDGGILYSEVGAGPLGGPYAPLAHCAGAGGDDRFSLSAGVLAYTPACAPGSPLEIRDLATATEQPFAAPASNEFELAGNFLALRTDADSAAVTVYDRRSGAEVYRGGLSGPSTPVAGRFDLQPDGKLAVSIEANLSTTARAAVIAWFSPSAPAAHILPQPQIAASTYIAEYHLPVRMADDTIVYTRPESPCDYNGITDLVETDLQGNVRVIDRVFATNPVTFDFDGQTVVWVGNRGGVPTLLAQNLTTDVPPLTPAEPANCPTVLAPAARIVEKAIRVSPGGGGASLLVGCLDPARAGQKSSNCSLVADVRSVHRVRLTPRSKPAIVHFAHARTFTGPIALVLTPAMKGTLTIVLDARQRALLRRVRRLAVEVTLTDYFTHARVARAEVTLIARR
jgi:hypothetical protein